MEKYQMSSGLHGPILLVNVLRWCCVLDAEPVYSNRFPDIHTSEMDIGDGGRGPRPSCGNLVKKKMAAKSSCTSLLLPNQFSGSAAGLLRFSLVCRKNVKLKFYTHSL